MLHAGGEMLRPLMATVPLQLEYLKGLCTKARKGLVTKNWIWPLSSLAMHRAPNTTARLPPGFRAVTHLVLALPSLLWSQAAQQKNAINKTTVNPKDGRMHFSGFMYSQVKLIITAITFSIKYY